MRWWCGDTHRRASQADGGAQAGGDERACGGRHERAGQAHRGCQARRCRADGASGQAKVWLVAEDPGLEPLRPGLRPVARRLRQSLGRSQPGQCHCRPHPQRRHPGPPGGRGLGRRWPRHVRVPGRAAGGDVSRQAGRADRRGQHRRQQVRRLDRHRRRRSASWTASGWR